MAADMRTIAEMLGVSKTTVHRALTDTGRISPQTKARVLALAEHLDYRPNNLARGLRSQRSATIGVLAVGIAYSFYAGIMDGVEDVAASQGYNVLLASSRGDPEREIAQLNMLREKRVDGMIIAPASPTENLDYYRRMARIGMPFVLIDRYLPGLDTHFVTTDNFQGGYIAGKHLIGLGRRKLGFVTTSRMERMATSVIDRISGLAACAKEHGLGPIQVIGEDTPDIEPAEEFARRAVLSFLESHGEVDSIFAVNDPLAVGAIHGFREAGLRVPDDVAVIGYDDLLVAPYVQPPLTSIRQQKRGIGEEAVRLLLAEIGGSPDARTPKHVFFPPELVVRESCGASGAGQAKCGARS